MDDVTEIAWNTSTEVTTMLAFVAGRDAPPGSVLPLVPMSERKLRLFLVGCCRQRWELFGDRIATQSIVEAERYADGEVEMESLRRAESAAVNEYHAFQDDEFNRTTKRPSVSFRFELSLCSAAIGCCQQFSEQLNQHIYYGRSRDFIPIHPSSRCIRADGVLRGVRSACLENQEFRFGDTVNRRVLMDAEDLNQAHLLRCIAGNPFRPVAFDPIWRTETVVALASAIYTERAFDRMPILADALEESGCDPADVLSHCRGPGPHARGCWVVDGVLGKE